MKTEQRHLQLMKNKGKRDIVNVGHGWIDTHMEISIKQNNAVNISSTMQWERFHFKLCPWN